MTVMYVCICRNVTDHQIRDAVSGGAETLSDLQQCLGVADNCGRCGDCAKRILNQALDECAACPLRANQVA